MFKIARQMRKERKNVVELKQVRDENGTLKIKEEEVMERWRSHYFFSSLLKNETSEYQLEMMILMMLLLMMTDDVDDD